MLGIASGSHPAAGVILVLLAVVLAMRSLGTGGRRSILGWLFGVRAPGWNGTRGVALLELAFLGIVVAAGVTSALAVREAQQAKKAEDEAQAAAQTAREEHLISEAPALAAELRQELDGLAETASGPGAIELDAALQQLSKRAGPTLALRPVPEGIQAVAADVKARRGAIAPTVTAATIAARAAQLADQAEGHVRGERWLPAEEAYSKALSTLESIDEAHRGELGVDATRGGVERARSRIASKVRTARAEAAELAKRAEELRKRKEAEAAERARRAEELRELKEACGGELESTSKGFYLHGSLELHLMQGAHDPDSIDVTNCTTPVLTELCWKTTCTVRGKNAFGALIAKQQTFYFRPKSLGIVEVLASE